MGKGDEKVMRNYGQGKGFRKQGREREGMGFLFHFILIPVFYT